MDEGISTRTITSTRQRVSTIPRPPSISAFSFSRPSATTTATSTLGIKISEQVPGHHGVLRTTQGPSKSLIVFWGIIMTILFLIFFAYVGFTVWFLVQAVIQGRKKLEEKARRAAAAARESVAPGQTSPARRIIIEEENGRGRRRSSFWPGRSEPALLRELEIREGYEMSSLSPPPNRRPRPQTEDDEGSVHVRWAGGATGLVQRPRAQSTDRQSGRSRREAQIWSGVSSMNINDIDENVRVEALRQLREMQNPVRTDYGDDDQWSPRSSGESFRGRQWERTGYGIAR